MLKNRFGMTMLESVVLLLLCAILAWVVVPILMIRIGWKDAGAMVVTEGDKAPEFTGEPIDPQVLKPRVEISVPTVPVKPPLGEIPPPPKRKSAFESF